MTVSDAHIRACQEQVIRYLEDHPEQCITTSTIRGTAADGLSCQVTQDEHSVLMDMGRAMGGMATAPSPGFFVKAGIVGCIAIATKMTAARLGLQFRSVDVEVETDTDALAVFGTGERNAAPLDVRIRIFIDSDETDEKIDALVSRVLAIDTWFLALRDPQPVSIGWERQQVVA